MTKSMSETGLSKDRKELRLKPKKKKKVVERGFDGSVTFDERKFQLMCKCNGGGDYAKALGKVKTQPVLAYKVDVKLRKDCEICGVMPHIIVKPAEAKMLDKRWEDQ